MSQAIATELTDLLDRQLSALEAVMDVLARERDALRDRDVERLERITADKQERLAAAASFEQHRRELAPDPATMDSLAEAPAVGERWAKLLDLTRACRDQSEENSRVIRQQRRVENTLSLVRGRGDQPDLYGSDGGNHKPGQSRTPLTSV
ncbi:MAG: flagella synthesis protein FlgN [Gammaproteobacteria bacterium]